MERKDLETVIDYYVHNLSKRDLQDMAYEHFVGMLWDDEELLINSIETSANRTVEILLREATTEEKGK